MSKNEWGFAETAKELLHVLRATALTKAKQKCFIICRDHQEG